MLRFSSHFSSALCRYFLFILFLSCSVYLRHLHSFPTRRSSDLTMIFFLISNIYLRRKLIVAFGTRDARLRMLRIWNRSEEHTSELQSLRHLVCRLLLEKKKTYYIQHISIPTLV